MWQDLVHTCAAHELFEIESQGNEKQRLQFFGSHVSCAVNASGTYLTTLSVYLYMQRSKFLCLVHFWNSVPRMDDGVDFISFFRLHLASLLFMLNKNEI